MPDPLIYSYPRLEDAVAARNSLLSAGVDPVEMEIRVIADEAGPVEGNFLVGNGRNARDDTVETGNDGGPDAPPYAENFADVGTRGLHLLVVGPEDPDLLARAAAVLRDSGGVDAAGAGLQGARTP